MVREKLCAKLACLTLGVSRSGFYAWMRRPEAQRKAENKALVAQIRSIHAESRGTYGSPRVLKALKITGFSCGKSRVEKLMRANQITGNFKRRFRIRTTDSNGVVAQVRSRNPEFPFYLEYLV